MFRSLFLGILGVCLRETTRRKTCTNKNTFTTCGNLLHPFDVSDILRRFGEGLDGIGDVIS